MFGQTAGDSGSALAQLVTVLLVCTVPLAMLLWLVALAVMVRSLHRQVRALRSELEALRSELAAGSRAVPAVLAPPQPRQEADDVAYREP